MTPERFLAVAGPLPEPTVLVSGEGIVLAGNPAVEVRLRAAASQWRGRRLADLVADAPHDVARYLQLCARSRQLVLGALRVRGSGGTAGEIACRAEGCLLSPKTDASSALLLLRLLPKSGASEQFAALNLRIDELAREVRRRRQVEETLRQQEERLRTTLASIGDGVITTDTEGRITGLNPVAETLTGWTAADAVGRPLDAVFRIINEETRLPVDNPAFRALRTGVVVGLANHTLLIARDGSERPIDDSAAPIRRAGAEVIGCVLVFRDVSERRQLEKETQQHLHAARLLASIVESSVDAIIRTSLDGSIQSWNPAAERLFGYGAAEALGRHVGLVIPPDRLAEETRIMAALQAGRHIEPYETERQRRGGERIFVSLTVSAVKDDHGRVVGAAEILRDITRQQRAEQRSRELMAEAAAADAKFRAFFEQGALFAGIMHVDGTIIEPNRLCLEGCGYTREQVVGKPFWECPWWSPSAELMQRIREASARAAAGETFRAELPYFVADGSQRIVDFILLPIKDESGRVLFLAPTGTDITDRKRAERQLAEAHQFLHSTIDALANHIAVLDENGVILAVNAAWRTFADENRYAGVDYGVASNYIEQSERTTGSCSEGSAAAHALREVLAGRMPSFEVEYPCHSPTERRWFLMRVTRFQWSGPPRVVVAHENVTQRRQAEEALRLADRRKDEFLATLAHELRNPLAPVRNAVQVLHLKGAAEPEVRWAREVIDRQMQQMTRLIDDLMDMSRISRGTLELRKQRVGLAQVVEAAIETSRPLIQQHGHELTVTLPDEPVRLDADLTRLSQVFANLLNNAAKYTEHGGQIRLSAQCRGAEVLVSVKDTGIGIAADQLRAVFEMFVQVQSAVPRSQGGLGIGLSLVKRLVEMHGGTITARSEGPGRGSEFEVRLPVALQEMPALPANAVDEPAAGATPALRILIVDDNRDGADSLAMTLELMGHESRTAYDGAAALRTAAEFRPDAVLLDIGLPQTSGYDVCRRMREQPWGRDVVLIAITGWGQQEDRRKSEQAGFDRHLVKPVDPKLLSGLLGTLTIGTSGGRRQRPSHPGRHEGA